jgi:hypothetical protein
MILGYVNRWEIVKKNGNYEKKYSEYYHRNEITVILEICGFLPLD